MKSFFRILFLICIFIIAFFLLKPIIPNFKQISLNSYYNMQNDKLYVAIDDYYPELDNFPVIENDEVYLPLDLIRDYIDEYIFWDENEKKLTITTSSKVIRIKPDELTYYVNNSPMKLNLPIQEINSKIYIPANFAEEMYNLQIKLIDEYNIVKINRTDKNYVIGNIKKKTKLRYAPDIKSPIAKKLPKDTKLTIYTSNEKFTRVCTDEGLIGYVPTKNIINKEIQEATVAKNINTDSAEDNKIHEKIVMVWDQMEFAVSNQEPDKKQIIDGLNVISPTWFKFDKNSSNADIISIADKSYVNWAHQNGYQVWALLSDNFDYDINNMAISKTSNREHIIKQLLTYVSMYELDGISIDFEAVSKDNAECYLQFLREISPFMKQQGVVLSVNMFVPTAWSKYYNRQAVGEVVDYICVMAYDEHTSNSKTSGPVASYKFVHDGIVNTLKEVPKEKIILGIPFYVRVWREEEIDGKIEFTIQNRSMQKAYDIFTQHGAKFIWLDDIRCYYAEYQVQEAGKTITYKTWLEDEKSIEEKLKLANTYDLAGVSGWKRSLEKAGIWKLISDYMK